MTGTASVHNTYILLLTVQLPKLPRPDLDKVINADKIAILVVTELPRITVRNESVWNVQRLGKVDHPRADTHVVRDDEQGTTNDLYNTARTANNLTQAVRCSWSTYFDLSY